MRIASTFFVALAFVLLVAGAASAGMRERVLETVGGALPAVSTALDGGDGASPSPSPVITPTPLPSASADPGEGDADETAGDEADGNAGQHGATVSAVARDKGAVAGKTLPNGNVVTNHGQAVSAVASGNGNDGGKDDK